ncbi:MAG: hypothetical protein AAB512_02710 [Patescibacteria group bacterium]
MDTPDQGEGKDENHVEISASSPKQAEWDAKVEEFSHVADKLSQPIDPGIFEAVVALNLLDVNTAASCEGHLDDKQRLTPWIDLQSLEADSLSKRFDEDQSDESLEALRKSNLAEGRKVMGHLDHFYSGRNTPYEKRIVLKPYGDGTVRMEIQETSLDPSGENLTATNLLAYRGELQDFGKYLKLKFLSADK